MNASTYTVSRADGERADFPTLGNRFILTGEQTDGRFGLIEHTIPPKGLAAPMHSHENEDEYSFVLAGRMGAMIGDEVVEAGPGDLVLKPRGIPHSFWNAGDEEVRVLELISPAGFEQYFREMAPLVAGGGPPDPQAAGQLMGRYRLTMDFDSIGELIGRFGLRR